MPKYYIFEADYWQNRSTSEGNISSSRVSTSLNPLNQPSSSSAQPYLSEECPRGWSGSGSSPRGAQPELIVSEQEKEEHVRNPVGLSALQPDGMERLQAKPGHNRLKTGNHLEQCLNDKPADLSVISVFLQRGPRFYSINIQRHHSHHLGYLFHNRLLKVAFYVYGDLNYSFSIQFTRTNDAK